jgi:hypothetical protein
MNHWRNPAALPPAAWSSHPEAARRPRENRAVMSDGIPDAQFCGAGGA